MQSERIREKGCGGLKRQKVYIRGKKSEKSWRVDSAKERKQAIDAGGKRWRRICCAKTKDVSKRDGEGKWCRRVKYAKRKI